MKIALFCATARGLRFFEALRRCASDAELVVFSFREEAWEPPFLDDIRHAAHSAGAAFRELRSIDEVSFEPADLLFAVSWRYLVPSGVIARPRLGAYVFHDSLLPEYRGFAPTVWAIVNGEDHTGASLVRMGERIDEGDIIDQRSIAIGDDDTIATAMERVTQVYIEILEANIDALRSDSVKATPQDHARATYGCKRVPEDARIDWHRTSREILNLIRASTSPYPGAFTTLDGAKLIIWSASPVAEDFPRYSGRIPGRVIGRDGEGVLVLTGDGAILVRELQLEGEARAPAASRIAKLSRTLR